MVQPAEGGGGSRIEARLISLKAEMLTGSRGSHGCLYVDLQVTIQCTDTVVQEAPGCCMMDGFYKTLQLAWWISNEGVHMFKLLGYIFNPA